MKLHTPKEMAEKGGSKYQGCVIAAKYARKLHNQYRDSTQFLDKKFTTESLDKLSEGNLNYEIVDRRMSKKKAKSIFPDKA
ncbi:MAG: DNA-directed RNA polymerase subunit omega [Candidatus Glassbacteria bacterium]|nr:DNA-directed RNA polymerase subunit omega [Candidatus Glassbacteria bacterium]